MEHQCLPDVHKTFHISTMEAVMFVHFIDCASTLSPFYIHFMWKFGKGLPTCNLVFFPHHQDIQ